MKKILIFLILALGIPALAGWLVMLLWNGIVVDLCRVAEVGYPAAIGLFFLGQIMSGGLVIGVFVIGGAIHHFGHEHHHRNVYNHWHSLTPEQRREFIERRRAWFGHMPEDVKDSSWERPSERSGE